MMCNCSRYSTELGCSSEVSVLWAVSPRLVFLAKPDKLMPLAH